MNINKNNIHVFPYPGDRIDEHPSLNYLFNHYLPTIESKVRDVLSVKIKRINPYFLEQDLPQNIWIDNKELENNKYLIRNNLAILSEILWDKKPIVLLTDWCFTNDLLIKELHEILENEYEKYVDIVDISYTDESKNINISDKLYENSITILWWSYCDLEDVPDSIFEWDLAKHIKNVHNNKINSKMLWICWWMQLISSIIWYDEKDSARIKTTYKWPLQVWWMIWQLTTDTRNIAYNYRSIVNSITNNWKNSFITIPLTRTGHVDYNFLDSYQLNSNSIHTFITDPITWSPLVSGTYNWNITLVQWHLEVDYNRDKNIYESEINSLINIFWNTYGTNVENILLNTWWKKYVSLAQSFYSSVLLSQTNSIIDKINYFSNNKNEKKYTYDENITQNSINEIILWLNFNDNSYLKDKSLIENLDEQWVLRLSTFFDWKINRWIIDASEILWLDLEKLIKKHKSSLNWNYIFRDWWAWNGKLIEEITNKLEIKWYGVSDFAYFDIYESIINLLDFWDIPKNILKIFVQELIENYNKLDKGKINEKIKKSIESIQMKSQSYKLSSMFSEKTYRFNWLEKELSDDEKEYLEKNSNRIEKLKKYIIENFYDIIIWNFDNSIFSDFNSFYIPNSPIKQTDFQVAIRSTCHVDWKDLEKVIQDYANISAKPGSIYIDNWVVRSDSWVARIKEYKDLEKNNKDIKVYFVYDSKTSYVTSAIILKEPFYDRKNIESNLKEWYILLSTNEIDECDFFKVERFFRELMVFVFENFKFNHVKNKEIVSFLKELSEQMWVLSLNDIKDLIISKINTFILDINMEFWEKYTIINSEHFDFYISKSNDDIKSFFERWNINNPKWFNKAFERKN